MDNLIRRVKIYYRELVNICKFKGYGRYYMYVMNFVIVENKIVFYYGKLLYKYY